MITQLEKLAQLIQDPAATAEQRMSELMAASDAVSLLTVPQKEEDEPGREFKPAKDFFASTQPGVSSASRAVSGEDPNAKLFTNQS